MGGRSLFFDFFLNRVPDILVRFKGAWLGLLGLPGADFDFCEVVGCLDRFHHILISLGLGIVHIFLGDRGDCVVLFW